MTTFSPNTHPLLFLTDLTGITDFTSFQASGETIWAVDAVLSCLATAGLLDIAIQDTAPTGTAGQKQIWVDPAADPTNAASSVKIYDVTSNSWQIATLELTVQLIGRVGNFTNVADNGATFAQFESENPGTGSLGVLTIDTLSSLFHSRSAGKSIAIGVGSDASVNNVVVIGGGAGAANTGSGSVIIGSDAGAANTGVRMVTVGQEAGQNNTGGDGVSVGYQAGQNNTGGDSVIIGRTAGVDNTGEDSVIVGRSAGESNTGDNTTVVGSFAGQNNMGGQLTAIGRFTAQSNTAVGVTAVGYIAGRGNSGDEATIVGNNTGSDNSGYSPIILGAAAGQRNSGDYNVIVGRGAGSDSTGNQMIAIGNNAGNENTGDNVVAIGQSACRFGEGNETVSMGLSSARYTTMSLGVALGTRAGEHAGGSSNVGIGSFAGRYSNGDENTFIGGSSGPSSFTDGSPITANFDPATRVVTTPAHGFTIGSYISLRLDASTAPAGLSVGGVYKYEVISATTLRSMADFSTTGVSCTVIPATETNRDFNNTTGIGYNANPDRDNQVVLGDTRVEQVKTAGTYVMGEFTPTTLPPAADHRAGIAYLRSGLGTGQDICVVHSDGVNWRKIENGAIQA